MSKVLSQLSQCTYNVLVKIMNKLSTFVATPHPSYLQPSNSKDARLPVQLQRAMAAEAEAAREARAKVIAAEGEQKASRALREASEVIAESSSALQLRYLQVILQMKISFLSRATATYHTSRFPLFPLPFYHSPSWDVFLGTGAILSFFPFLPPPHFFFLQQWP